MGTVVITDNGQLPDKGGIRLDIRLTDMWSQITVLRHRFNSP